MTITRSNSFESGLGAGTAITNAAGGNSGGAAGDFLNAVFASAGNSITYSATAMHGTRSAQLLSAGGGSASIGYDWKEGQPTYSTTAMRAYYRFSSLHAGNTVIMQTRGVEAGSTGFFVRYNAEGKVQVLQSSGNVILATSTVALSLNIWYRMEFRVTTAGEWALRVYQGDTYVMPFPELSGDGAVSGMPSNEFTFWRWAQDGSAVNATTFVDDVAYADDWIGPVAGTEARPVSLTGAGWLPMGSVGAVVAVSDNTELTYLESPNLTTSYQPANIRIAELGPGDVSVRVKLSGDTGPTARIRLLQGAAVVATWTAASVPATPTDYIFNVSVADSAKITNRADLRVEVGGIL